MALVKRSFQKRKNVQGMKPFDTVEEKLKDQQSQNKSTKTEHTGECGEKSKSHLGSSWQKFDLHTKVINVTERWQIREWGKQITRLCNDLYNV